jgi:protein-L-isoaspartate(D-aspartate) O-methyltransferase
MALDIDSYGGAGIFKWTHEHLIRVLTTGEKPLVHNKRLIAALTEVKRSDFVPEELSEQAFTDHELDIGFGEKLNQPTVIAQMLELLNLKTGGKYLDVGTGSGWVAALLGVAAGDSGHVYSLERIQFLIDLARMNLARYPELDNVEVVFRDGSKGLEDFAPFDGIHISAAFAEVPETFKMQLAIGGKAVVPTHGDEIVVVERTGKNEFKETIHPGFFFGKILEGVE